MNFLHKPILVEPIIAHLNLRPNQNFIDCTVGGGGHTYYILQKFSGVKVLAIDWDEKAITIAKENLKEFKDRVIFVNDSYTNLVDIVTRVNFVNIYGILLDLGMSSYQLELSGRGFSFLKAEPLDMRFSKKSNLTAYDIVNKFSEQDIMSILKEYGEEVFAGRIAKNICKYRKERKIKTTSDLVEIVYKSVPKKLLYRKKHPATRVFQALRIFVNNEFENIQKGLNSAIRVLEKGGRLFVISFHSLEDRIVKQFFKDQIGQKTPCIKLVNKKVIKPTIEEIKQNPRSRSAKLRIIEKII